MPAIIQPEQTSHLQTHCDFCHQPKDVDGRYLLHNPTCTEAICNFCVLFLHQQLMQIEFLRYAPLETRH